MDEEGNHQAARVGEVLAGKYRIERHIGKGGMGVVLEATHLRLDEPVAIKLMLPKLAKDAGIVERFMREARAASKIKSPHVVRVIDVDVLDSGEPYMVLELLEGYTLSQLRRTTGTLDADMTAAFIAQACDAIAEAHGLGIVHRDLKPSNLFIRRDRDGNASIKVLDFGISKVGAAIGAEEITHTDQLLGSPSYMSPEQLRSSRTVDGRTDIWSLGVVLYHCVTGKPPFEAPTMPQVCMQVLMDEPTPPRALRADIPEGLEAAILRCLSKDPEGRFATAAELADALAPFAHPAPLPWPDVTVADNLAPASARSAALLVPIPEGSSPSASSQPELVSASGDDVSPVVESGAAADVAASGKAHETQVGWGTTLGFTRARSTRKWIVAAVAALLVVGAGAALAIVGFGPETDPTDGSAEQPEAATATAAPSTYVETSAADNADTATGDELASKESDAGERPEAAAATASATDSAARTSPGTARTPTPGTRPPRRPPASGRTGRGKVDPFGVSRQ